MGRESMGLNRLLSAPNWVERGWGSERVQLNCVEREDGVKSGPGPCQRPIGWGEDGVNLALVSAQYSARADERAREFGAAHSTYVTSRATYRRG